MSTKKAARPGTARERCPVSGPGKEDKAFCIFAPRAYSVHTVPKRNRYRTEAGFINFGLVVAIVVALAFWYLVLHIAVASVGWRGVGIILAFGAVAWTTWMIWRWLVDGAE